MRVNQSGEEAIIWIFFFFKENCQLCNLMQTVSGIFALKDAVGRNRSQNPFRVPSSLTSIITVHLLLIQRLNLQSR